MIGYLEQELCKASRSDCKNSVSFFVGYFGDLLLLNKNERRMIYLCGLSAHSLTRSGCILALRLAPLVISLGPAFAFAFPFSLQSSYGNFKQLSPNAVKLPEARMLAINISLSARRNSIFQQKHKCFHVLAQG